MKLAMAGLVAVCVALAACGATREAGDACSPEGGAVCESDSAALFCNDGKLRTVPCPGPGGCTENSTQAVCDFSRARAGDGCPKSADNLGQCDAANANQLLRCTGRPLEGGDVQAVHDEHHQRALPAIGTAPHRLANAAKAQRKQAAQQ